MHRIALSFVVLTMGAAGARADVVTLKNGSRIVGQVERLEDGKLRITTDFAGELLIDFENVRGISTETPRTVQLDTGERNVGPMQFDETTGQAVAAPGDAPDRRIDVDNVQSLWHPEDDSPELAAAKKAAEDARAKWTVQLLAGLNGQSGNSERLSINGRAEANRTTPEDRLKIFAEGRYSKENGVRTANEIIGGSILEVDITDRLFWFAKGTLEHDEFENLKLRANVTGGLGYFLIREDIQDLKVRVGVGYEHESFDDGTTEDSALGELGVDYRRELAPYLLYTFSATYYPKFDDPMSDYRLVVENAGEIPLTDEEDWKLRLGVRNQYDSMPVGDVERLDTYYFANIVWDMK